MGGIWMAWLANGITDKRLLVRVTAIVACMLGIWLLTTASGASAALPEFNLLSAPVAGGEGTTTTQMNMTTGEFSGTSLIDGESFTVQGIESGNVSQATLTLDGGGYEAHDTDYYEILPNGNIGGPGEVDGGGTYFGEVIDAAQTVTTVTSPSCTPSGSSDTCSATVTGAGGTPTGNLTFSATAGTFVGEAACQMSDGTCSVTYQPPAGSVPPVVSAVYSGDATFRPSQRTTKEQEEAVATREIKEREEVAREKAAKEAKEKESSGKRKASVVVTCTINLDGSKPSTCTAQVGDGTGGNPVEVPTGSVRFSTALGSFLGSDTCTLSMGELSGNTSSCTVQYAPPPNKSIVGTELPITATYSGDTHFNSGEGAFKLAQKGIQAEEFEDERVNREVCEADEGITAEINEKKYEVTIPYTAPDDGTVQASLETLGSSLGAGVPGPGDGGSPLVLASSAENETTAPSSSISKDCEADLTLALAGAKTSALSSPLAGLARKKPKTHSRKSKKADIVIAETSVKVKHAGKLELHIRLNKRGKQLVSLMKRGHKHVRIKIKLQFGPPHAKSG